ncbi:MAG: cysteine synthase family protein [Bacilli bacterium]|nr:cysteine synthase family protein [Bacilli bacterium]
MIYNSILELIGNTPLVRLQKIEKSLNTNCQIYGKLEKQNPAGSAKDRAVFQILKDMQAQGLLHEGSTIVEPTSGNTGIALACLACYFSYHAIIVMPSSMSEQRKALMKDYQAELVLVDGNMTAAINKAKEIVASIKGAVMLFQFSNPSNPKAHFLTTGEEIIADLPDVDYVLAGIGTGGTISGIGEALKKKGMKTKIIGLEPSSSPFITKGIAGKHKIQGIGAGFIPDNFLKEYVDEVQTVDDDQAIQTAKDLVKEEGLFVGISSGASLAGAINLIKERKLEKKKIVVIFPDSGERYSW